MGFADRDVIREGISRSSAGFRVLAQGIVDICAQSTTNTNVGYFNFDDFVSKFITFMVGRVQGHISKYVLGSLCCGANLSANSI